MSASIDERIVEMKFDNSDFERGAQNSMKTLRDLDNSLQLENGTRGFAAIAQAAGNVSFDALTTGIESVGSKFSALEVAAITVISNITNSLINAAKRVGNELLIEPIREGMQEYETKMDMVQTTVINSGRSLEEVNDTLDELNHYADKTIFKFSDMTSALSKFTMSGITDLNLASTMIEGIGNIAGESGLKTEQASSAFYMISQAISAGKMSLYQWRTLENTGFASMKFKNNLLETAEALGKIEKIGEGIYRAYTDKGKAIDLTAETLRNSLTETGWMDSEVMQTIFARYASPEATKALAEATGKTFEDISEAAYHAAQDVKTFSQMWDTLKEAAQSGWTETWEIVIGNYEEAKQLWGGINEVISGMLDKHSEARNSLLQGWKDLGGRQAIIDAAVIAWTKLGNVLYALKGSFDKVFPPITSKRLAEMSENVKKFFENMRLGSNMHETARIGYVFESILKLIKELQTRFTNIISFASKGIKGALFFTESFFDVFDRNAMKIKKFFDGLRENLKWGSTIGPNLLNISTLFARLTTILLNVKNVVWDVIKVAFGQFINVFSGTINLFDRFNERMITLKDELKEFANRIKLNDEQLGLFSKGFEYLFKTVKTVIGYILDTGKSIGKVFKEMFPKETINIPLLFFEAMKKVNTIITDVWHGSEVFEKVVTALFSVIKVGIVIVKQAARVFSLLFDVFTSLASSGTGIITNIISKVADLITAVSNWIIQNEVIENTVGFLISVFTNIKDTLSKVVNYIKDFFAPAWEILTDAINNAFSKQSDKKTGFFDSLLNILQTVTKGIVKAVEVLIPVFGKIINFFGNVLESMAKGLSDFIDMASDNGLGNAITSMTVGFGTLLGLKGAWNIYDFFGDWIEMGKALIEGLKSMVDVVGGLEELKDATVFKMKADMIKELAIAIAIMAASFIMLSMADLDKVAVAFGFITATIVELMTTMEGLTKINKLGNAFQFTKLADGLVKIAASVLIASIALKMLSNIEPEALESAILGMTAIFGELIATGIILGKYGKNINKICKSFISLAVSMLIFAFALKAMSKIETADLWKSVGAMGAVLLMLDAFVALLSKKGAKNFSKISGGMIAVAVSMILFAKAISMLGSLDGNQALGGLAAMGAILLMIDIFSKIIGKQSKSLSTMGVAMIAIAAAMVIFAGAVALFGLIPVPNLIAGIASISTLILVLALATQILKPLNLIALAGALAIVSVSMGVFAVAMKVLASIPFDVLATDIVILFASLALFGVLSVLLQPFIGGMYALVGVFAIFSVSAALLGVAVFALSAGITALGIALASFGGGVVIFITELLTLIPIFFEELAAGFIAFIAGLAASAAQIVKAIVAIGEAILDGLIILVPKILELVMLIIVGILDLLIEATPKLIKLVEVIIVGILDLLEVTIPKLCDLIRVGAYAVCDLLVELIPLYVDTFIRILVGVWEALQPWFEKLWPALKGVFEKVKEKILELKDKVLDIGKDFIDWLVEGIKSKISAAVDAVKEVATNVIDSVKRVFDVHSPSRVMYEIGEYVDEGLADGIRDAAKVIHQSTEDVGDDTIDGMKRVISRIDDAVHTDMDTKPTITPVLDLSNLKEGSKAIQGILHNQNGVLLVSGISGNFKEIDGFKMPFVSEAPSSVVNNYDFTQTINSPKPMSRIDIYRQTNNQFNRFKGVVGAI